MCRVLLAVSPSAALRCSPGRRQRPGGSSPPPAITKGQERAGRRSAHAQGLPRSSPRRYLRRPRRGASWARPGPGKAGFGRVGPAGDGKGNRASRRQAQRGSRRRRRSRSSGASRRHEEERRESPPRDRASNRCFASGLFPPQAAAILTAGKMGRRRERRMRTLPKGNSAPGGG